MSQVESAAQSGTKVYAVYFCSEDLAQVAGEGEAALAQYKKEHHGDLPPNTLFDQSSGLSEMRKAGVVLLAKVPNTKANAASFGKYAVTANSLVICAPNGDQLGVLKASEINEMDLKKLLVFDFKRALEAWRKKQGSAVAQEASSRKK